MNISAGLVQKMEDFDPKIKDIFFCFMDEIEEKTSIIAVGRGDFDELKNVVRQLAEAQNRTEHRLEELAVAQNRTEHRVEELAESQNRTEHRLEELAVAQRELAVAQRELAVAQKQTEITVTALVVGQEKLRSELGGLSMDVGYGIEDKMIPHLRQFALHEFGIEVTLVDRRNVFYPDGNHDEVNLYVEGKKDGHTQYLIGECKAQPGKKDFDKFSQELKRLQSVLKGEITPFMVGYHFAPEVESYAVEQYPQILRYKTFQITAYKRSFSPSPQGFGLQDANP
jgi:predicted transcriptional regulator